MSMRHKLTWAHWHHETLGIREACLKIKIHTIFCCRIAQLPLQCGVDCVLMAEFESRNKHDIISIIFVVVVKHTSAIKGNYINYVLSLQGYQHHLVRKFYCDEHIAQGFSELASFSHLHV